MNGKNWTMGLLLGAAGGVLITLGATGAFTDAESDASGPGEADAVPASVMEEERDRLLSTLRADLDRGLARWYSGDPLGYAELYAEDLTYFDPGTETSLQGIESLRAYYEPLVDRFHIDRYETDDFRLQHHVEIAILTFTLSEYAAGDDPTVVWKVTHAYRQVDGEWRVIHGHFSQVAAGE